MSRHETLNTTVKHVRLVHVFLRSLIKAEWNWKASSVGIAPEFFLNITIDANYIYMPSLGFGISEHANNVEANCSLINTFTCLTVLS